MNDTIMVVTGVSSGVGATAARTLGRVGATVIACARDDDALQSVINDIKRDDSSVSAVRADVRGEPNMERLMETAACAGGCIDVPVASAVVAYRTPGEMSTPEDSCAVFDDTFRTNARGVFAVVKEVLPHTTDNGRTPIPSSSITREVKPGMDAYVISKAAAETLVRQFVTDYDRTMTVIDPDLVAADLTGRQGRDPDGVTDLLVWAVIDANPTELDGDIADLKAQKQATR